MDFEAYLKENELQIIKNISERILSIRKKDLNDELSSRIFGDINLETRKCWLFLEEHFNAYINNVILIHIGNGNKAEFNFSVEEVFILLFYYKMSEKHSNLDKALESLEEYLNKIPDNMKNLDEIALFKNNITFFYGKTFLFDFVVEMVHRFYSNLSLEDFNKLLNTPLEQIKILENKIIKTIDLLIQKETIDES